MIQMQHKKNIMRPLPLLVFVLFVFYQTSTLADGPDQSAINSVNHLIDKGGYAVEKDNHIIVGLNLDELFVPASTFKIATGLTALHVLGPDYRFETYFFRDEDKNLYIKGFGDPFLISEEVSVIVRKLKELGCEKVNNIYLDDTAFAIDGLADGTGLSDNPYDARNSALAVNFNTVNIEKVRSGEIYSAEKQTPTLDLMVELAADLDKGIHRINITKETPNGDTVIRRYVGELFREFQKQDNIAGNGKIAFRKVPDNLAPYYVHHSSKTLLEILGPLMLYSNNFIANQLFLTVGAAKYGYPATWEKSIKAETSFLHDQLGLSENEIRIVEGSGLSRRNHVTPHAMIRILDSFKPYGRFLPVEDGRLIKSGTLKGVYSYAGYFIDKNKLDSFVLLLNQEKNNRDQILQNLEQLYRK